MRTSIALACSLVAALLADSSAMATPPEAPPPSAAAAFSNTVLWVADAHRSAEFYHSVFGIKTHIEMKLGDYLWLELETGGTKLSFMSESEADQLFGKQYRHNRPDQPPQAIGLSFRVGDAAAAYAAALAAGATSIHAPKAEVWGGTMARVKDPDGIILDIIGPPMRAK